MPREAACKRALGLLFGALGWALVGAACAPAPPEALLELERLAFVPAGQGSVGFGLAGAFPYGAAEDLLVDLHEVTRDLWAQHFGAPPDPMGLRGEVALTGPGRGDWPAFCDFEGARELAARRGMRLLSADEWLWVALGPRTLRYPWGRLERASVANTLDLGVYRPLPVGAFEAGRGPFGHYDLLGNVWEWVEGDLPGFGDMPGSRVEPGFATLIGGSCLTRQRELWRIAPDGPRFFCQSVPRGTRSVEIGLRCAVEAEVYLKERAHALSGHRRRVTAVGRRWGRPAVPLLTRMVGERGAPSALFWLLEGAQE
jgi:hypothetical protein